MTRGTQLPHLMGPCSEGLINQDIPRPLRVMFVITSMHVGGAETLLVNLMRHFDPMLIVPSVACLKEPGELGEKMADEFAVHSHLIRHKFDIGVIRRLKRLFESERTDVVVTVGAGDKMFWGRLAGRAARVPVILSALHSTGWPDDVGRLNRLLTPLTDAFIAVAEPHRQYLINTLGFPTEKVRMIPNGIDTHRFVFCGSQRRTWRRQLGIKPGDPVCGIVAALRPEKNHELFLTTAESVGRQLPNAHFLIVGDGSRRAPLEQIASQLTSRCRVHFLGNCHDVPGVLSAMDVFSLTSRNEASPVSILEAMSIGLPVVAPNVGSIDQAVIHGQTGFLVEPGDQPALVDAWIRLLSQPQLRERFGKAARARVETYGSLDTMTRGYHDLIEEFYGRNTRTTPAATARNMVRGSWSGNPRALTHEVSQ